MRTHIHATQPSPNEQEARRQRELARVQQLLQEGLQIQGPTAAAGSLPSTGHPHSHNPQQAFVQTDLPDVASQETQAQLPPGIEQAVQTEAQNVAQQQMAAAAPPAPPVGRSIVNPLRQTIQRQTRDLQQTLGDVRTDIADEIVDLRGAVQEISQQNDLSAAELQTLLTNLEGGPDGNPPRAPLTAQLFAQGRLRARQLLNPAWKFKATRQHYATGVCPKKIGYGTASSESALSSSTRIDAIRARTLTAAMGARRYRQPRFAGPLY